MKNSAFTLAEVLITLAIIGVIAAISVPSLIQKTNQAELITAWKKNFATLSQALDNVMFNDGSINIKDSYALRNALGNQLKFVKSCDSPIGNCWHAAGVAKTLPLPNGTTYNYESNMSDITGAILNNGALLVIHEDTGYTALGWIMVDVNGFKSPNVAGRDIFIGRITSDGFVAPTEKEFGTCNPVSVGDSGNSYIGLGCSSYYLYAAK